MLTCRLTAAEIDWVDWALDAMADYVREEDCPYYGRPECLPTLSDGTLTFPTENADVVDDLLYRLTDQAWDVADTDAAPGEQSRRYRAAGTAAKKIRVLFPSECPNNGA